jgi:membrane protease YdiL (CAAX protease family)
LFKERILVTAEKEPQTIERPLLFGFILTIIYGFIAYLADLLELEQVLFASGSSPFASIFFKFSSRFTLSGILWLILLPIALSIIKGLSFRDYVRYLRLNQKIVRNIVIGLIISTSFVIAVVLTAIILGVYSSDIEFLVSPDHLSGIGWFIFVLALVPGIWEEIAFRGIILSFLVKEYSVKKAIIFNGLLFSLFHLFNYFILHQDLDNVILFSLAAIPVGIALSYLTIKRKSILPAILIHYTIDVTLFITGYIFDLSDEGSALVFALLAVFVFPPLLIYLFVKLAGNTNK